MPAGKTLREEMAEQDIVASGRDCQMKRRVERLGLGQSVESGGRRRLSRIADALDVRPTRELRGAGGRFTLDQAAHFEEVADLFCRDFGHIVAAAGHPTEVAF